VSKQIARKPTVPNEVSGVWFGDLCVSHGKSSGAPDSYRDGFALNFLFVLFFVSRQRKEHGPGQLLVT